MKSLYFYATYAELSGGEKDFGKVGPGSPEEWKTSGGPGQAEGCRRDPAGQEDRTNDAGATVMKRSRERAEAIGRTKSRACVYIRQDDREGRVWPLGR